jgi:hypothetical protein
MIDLIRDSAVPAHLMRTAARGALSLPAGEMLEILVYLSRHPLFGEQSQLTLASWDIASAQAVVSDPTAPQEVLGYFSEPQNLRPDLIAALLQNPSVPENRLLELAHCASRELPALMLASPRVRSMPAVLSALLHNPATTDAEARTIEDELRQAGIEVPAAPDLLEPELSQYLREHAAEIAAEEGKPFQLTECTEAEHAELAAAATATAGGGAFAAHALGARAHGEAHERVASVQKIARMTVGERVQLAMKGTRDERFILIRDGARVVSNAVLESPKLTDSEVEMFASMKNVSDTVLRVISSKRKFIKNYAVKRLLTANPRCPIDVSLPLAKELLAMDLKNLSMNRNIPDTVRRFAGKMWKEKTEAREK